MLGHMGIRYYAYAFDGELTEAVLAEPRSFIGADPLADAFGLPEGFTVGTTNFEQDPPEEDMLYLDKVWNNLQEMTRPSVPGEAARPSYRMFEGHVTPVDDYSSWLPWIRVIAPEEIAPIAADLDEISDADFVPHYSRHDSSEEHDSERRAVVQFLERARHFLKGLERTGRGFVYMIS